MNLRGMYWLDASPAPFAEKLARAAAYYEKKYGCRPAWCRVNQAMLKAARPAPMDGIRIVVDPVVLSDHLWIGSE